MIRTLTLDPRETWLPAGRQVPNPGYVLQCAGCDDPWGDAELPPVFASPDEAIRDGATHGWTLLGDIAYCAGCTERAVCAAAGHSWQPWHHFGPPGQRRRRCGRCATVNFDPPLDARRPQSGEGAR